MVSVRKAAVESRVRKPSEPSYVLSERFRAAGLVGRSVAIVKLLDRISRASHVTSPVLINEPSRVKRQIAEIIHMQSGRPGPFVPVDCSSLKPDALDGELFRGRSNSAAFERATKWNFVHR